MWETLLHEMVHAWEFVLIRPGLFAATHGPEFWDALVAMMERVGFWRDRMGQGGSGGDGFGVGEACG